MKGRHIIPVILACALASCMAPPYPESAQVAYPSVQGKVTDPDGNPVEHIMVTIFWGKGIEKDVQYTSSEGIFQTEIPQEASAEEIWMDITLEDIDGEENGGYFESLTDRVLLIQENPEEEEEIISLDYRLNHATPSENNPQT